MKQNLVFALDLQGFVFAMLFVVIKYAARSYNERVYLGGRGGRLNSELHTLSLKAFSIFENWPDDFYLFLDWCIESGRIKLPSRYALRAWRRNGNIPSGFYRELSASQYSFMREALREYFVTNST